MPLSFPRPDDRPRYGTGTLLKGITWLFCLGLIIVGWMFALQQMRFERQQAIDEAIAQNRNRVIAFEQYVRRTLEVASIATRYVNDRFRRGLAEPEFIGTAQRPTVLAGNFARSNPTFLGLVITNAQGDVITTSRPLPRPVNLAPFESFRVHTRRDSDELYVGQPFLSPNFRRQAIMLSRRINNPDGSFGGIVALLIAPEQFTAFYRNARVGPMDVISLIGLDGVTRARRTGDVVSAGEVVRGGLVMQMQLRDPNGTYLGPSVLDGQVRYFSHRRLTGYPLFATYGVLESEVLASPQRRARFLIIAMVLGTLATLGFAFVLTLLMNRGERRGREIEAANQRLEDAQRIGEIGDWWFNAATRETHWSPQTYVLHERDPALGPIRTREYRAMLDDESRDAIDRAFAAALEKGETQQFELKLALAGGTVAHHQVIAIPLKDDSGVIVGLRGTSQNVSGRKLLEQLQAQVAHLSRVEAMNAMAATLAHELNQPLAAAANYLAGTRRQLETEPGGSSGVTEGVTAAEQQILFAGHIIRQVREMVSNQPRSLSNFTLGAVIDDAVTVITAAGGLDLAPVKRLGADARRVRADRVQVQQVIINLLRNALDATGDVERPEIVVASRLEEKGMVLVSVSDNGPGFSRPEAERFSPTAGSSGTGMGLGLSISRTIVEANGGRIWTEDRHEGGATVCFTLPAATQRSAVREAAATA